METDKKNRMFQSSVFIFGAIDCFTLKKKGLQYLETSGIIDHSS